MTIRALLRLLHTVGAILLLTLVVTVLALSQTAEEPGAPPAGPAASIVPDTAPAEDAARRRDALLRMTMAFIACLVALQGISVIAVRRKVILPIADLVHDARRVSAGDLTTRTRRQSRDEVGTLARAFNLMIGRLQSIFADLRQRNDLVLAQKQKIELQAGAIAMTNLELQQAVGELHRTNDELREAGEFRMKMLGIASHDLRGPLGTIHGLAGLLQDRFHDKPDSAELASLIQNSAGQLLDLVRDLIDVSAREMGRVRLQPATFDVVELIGEAADQLRSAMEAKGQKLSWQPPGAISMVGDRERLRQVFDNLLSNAVKYSPHGGTIGVTIETGGDRVTAQVRDEGPGLTEEDRTRLFGYFQKLSARPTGGESSTGLGLALVKLIVELHGGRVAAESDGPGTGSTFRVDIPRFARDFVQDVLPSAHGASPPHDATPVPHGA